MKLRIIVGLLIVSLIIVSGCDSELTPSSFEKVQDIEKCENAKNIDMCYAELAINTSNKNLCYKIESEYYKDACFRKIGIEEKDTTICNQVADFDERESCIYEIAVESNNIDLCKKLKGIQSLCYQNFAKKNNDVSICDNVGEQYHKDKCYAYTSQELLDPAICPQIETDSWENKCWQYMAVGFKDESYCENVATMVYIEDEDRMVPSGAIVHCYSFTAKEKLDYTVCHKIPDENDYDKNQCYYDIAVKVNDSSICDYIDYSFHNKDTCYDAIG